MTTDTLSHELLYRIDAYWRAANYLSVGQIYLYDNPMLREPLVMSHIKPLVVGHWGTVPGQNFIYVHLNRVINKYGLNMLYVSGPGHGGAALVGNVYLEGTWSEVYPDVTQDLAGMKKLFKQFSFPGGISSHVAPTTPGSINEGGELGYSLSHAFGAAFDNPDLIVACVIGDGEAETGPLATAWHSNKLLNPVTDGAVLPILHLNGFKISNPTVLARIGHEELEQFFQGCGWAPLFVEGDDPMLMHQRMAEATDRAVGQIQQIQDDARNRNVKARPRWPMIVLRSPKGWTGPKEVDGLQIENTFRSHQVPLLVNPDFPEHARAMVADDKGLLAMDESNGTCNERFASLGIAQTVQTRRAYRELLLTTPDLGECISGVILYDETIRQRRDDGTPFVKVLQEVGILIGIKVDTGAKALAAHPGEKITEGLDGLRERLAAYAGMGAGFAKWRAVIGVGSSRACIDANAHALARYAALCQEAGLVPIVEPEVLMDGDHPIERCGDVTEAVLRRVFEQLSRQRVVLEAMILKPNMVLAGLACPTQPSAREVADATLQCLLRAVPAAIPGIAFLSGGQPGAAASERLNAMHPGSGMGNAQGLPWPLTYSFARALQHPALERWAGEDTNRVAAQQALLQRARCNRAALRGHYLAAMEPTWLCRCASGSSATAKRRGRSRAGTPALCGAAQTRCEPAPMVGADPRRRDVPAAGRFINGEP